MSIRVVRKKKAVRRHVIGKQYLREEVMKMCLRRGRRDVGDLSEHIEKAHIISIYPRLRRCVERGLGRLRVRDGATDRERRTWMMLADMVVAVVKGAMGIDEDDGQGRRRRPPG